MAPDDAAARRRDHRHAEAGTADTRALAARGRIHLRAENAGHDRRRSTRCLTMAGKPVDWTQEIWSPTHNQRPGAGGNLLGALALPDPPPEPPPNDVPEANGGGATRNAEPLYNIPAKRMLHHLVTEAPVRTSALRGLGATSERIRARMLHRRACRTRRTGPVAYRLSITADARARAVIEKVAGHGEMECGRCRRLRPRPRHCVRPVQEPRRLFRGGRRAFGRRSTSACIMSGARPMPALVINPDGVINQLEGGIISGGEAGC